MSFTFSTSKTSMSSASIFIGTSSSFSSFCVPSSSSPFSSPFSFWACSASLFFLAASFCFLASLYAVCFLFHSLSTLFHSDICCLNQLPGWMPSTRCVSFFSVTHCSRYSLHLISSCQTNLTSVKPSDSSGMLNFVMEAASSLGVKSWFADLRNHCFFSSSVSTIATSASRSAVSLFSSSLFSSSSATFSSSAAFSSLFSTSFFPAFASLARFASNAFFFLSSSAFLRSTSSLFFFVSFSYLTFNNASCTCCLKAASGSPIATYAIVRNSAGGKRARKSLRSSARSAARTSMTTRLRSDIGRT
mmetsp:Transcript_11223/g.29919  ORF Transcript_11223/g.29919 Transcript_11223/m.29919 type:complete len:303 (+) Transcript_11223:1006-1914(+)